MVGSFFFRGRKNGHFLLWVSKTHFQERWLDRCWFRLWEHQDLNCCYENLGPKAWIQVEPSEWRVKPQTHATKKSSICIVIDESLRDTKRRWTTITMKLEIPFDIPFLNILHQCCLSTWNWVYFILFHLISKWNHRELPHFVDQN